MSIVDKRLIGNRHYMEAERYWCAYRSSKPCCGRAAVGGFDSHMLPPLKKRYSNKQKSGEANKYI